MRDGWSRFDGPAGTQMVDVAINAMSEWAAQGSNANTVGYFAAADACDALLESTRSVVGEFLGADSGGICLGANMTTMTMALTSAVGQTLKPGDTVVGTQLDHEANVSPWRIACEGSGATHLLTATPRRRSLAFAKSAEEAVRRNPWTTAGRMHLTVWSTRRTLGGKTSSCATARPIPFPELRDSCSAMSSWYRMSCGPVPPA